MVTFAVDPLVDGMVASVRMKMGVIGVGEGLVPGKGRGQVNAVMVKARGKGDHRVLPILRRVLQRNCQKRGEINEMRNAADKKKYVLRTAAWDTRICVTIFAMYDEVMARRKRRFAMYADPSVVLCMLIRGLCFSSSCANLQCETRRCPTPKCGRGHGKHVARYTKNGVIQIAAWDARMLMFVLLCAVLQICDDVETWQGERDAARSMLIRAWYCVPIVVVIFLLCQTAM